MCGVDKIMSEKFNFHSDERAGKMNVKIKENDIISQLYVNGKYVFAIAIITNDDRNMGDILLFSSANYTNTKNTKFTSIGMLIPDVVPQILENDRYKNFNELGYTANVIPNLTLHEFDTGFHVKINNGYTFMTFYDDGRVVIYDDIPDSVGVAIRNENKKQVVLFGNDVRYATAIINVRVSDLKPQFEDRWAAITELMK